jgi:integrase/recombinase XerD
MKPTAKIYHDTRYEIKTGENAGRFPIKMMITIPSLKGRARKPHATGVFATVQELEKMKKGTKNTDLSDKWQIVKDAVKKAEQIFENNSYLTMEIFDNQFTSVGSYNDPLALMLARAKELIDEQRPGNAISFQQSAASLQAFIGTGITVSFAEITPQWLKRYELWMLEKDCSLSTVGIYLRSLRAIFNQERGKSIKNDVYPFRSKITERDKYKIPTGKKRKLALTEYQKNLLIDFKTDNVKMQKAIDFWSLSFYCYGLNFADILRWKVKNFDGNKLYQKRKKIENTSEQQETTIPILPEAMQIIRKYGSNSLDPKAYVFPVLKDDMTAMQKKMRVQDFIKDINEGLRPVIVEINKNLPDEQKLPKVTTYTARHTFATIMRRSGADISLIKEMLIHQHESTTEGYLSEFEFEEKQKWSAKLLSKQS